MQPGGIYAHKITFLQHFLPFILIFCKFVSIMKNLGISFLYFVAIAVLSSCQTGNGKKPLVGGITGAEKQTESTDISKADSNSLTIDDKDEYGLPAQSSHLPEQVLQRTGYTVSYNKDTKIPNLVACLLLAVYLEGTEKRPRKAFHEDEDVAEPRATDWDYYNSGFDRGHMCPAADNKWSKEAMAESFLFTNICPQNHGLNTGDWNEMEMQCRKWAEKYGDIYIVCGPVLYKGKHKTIGKNKVVVPEAFFKVVLCLGKSPKAIGFIYKNVSGNRPKAYYVNTVDDVERITGFDFFPALPDDIEKDVESQADISCW